MEQKFNTPNDLNLKVTGVNNQELVNEKCCTCINIILQNDGNIQTSFLGAHNPQILNCLEKTMKLYFKGIKKTLKHQFNELDEEECCGDDCCDDSCDCHNDHNDTCNCHEEKHEHTACDCHEKNHNQHSCCDNDEKPKKTKKNST